MDPKYFLIDLDGTTYVGDRLVEGAAEFVSWMRTNGKQFRFLTNNSSSTAEAYARKLSRLGISCSTQEVFTSTKATIAFLRANSIDSVFALGTKEFESDLCEAGIQLRENADCVVLAFDKSLSYTKANHAFKLISVGAIFVATHPDILCPVPSGYDLDCGAMTAMFERATGKSPIIIGKPNPRLLELALSELGATPAEAMMIGDRVYTDMRMGYEAGTKTALVLSGETKTASDLPFPVDFVVDNIGCLCSRFPTRQAHAAAM